MGVSTTAATPSRTTPAATTSAFPLKYFVAAFAITWPCGGLRRSKREA
jgi:hypothetical protein